MAIRDRPTNPAGAWRIAVLVVAIVSVVSMNLHATELAVEAQRGVAEADSGGEGVRGPSRWGSLGQSQREVWAGARGGGGDVRKAASGRPFGGSILSAGGREESGEHGAAAVVGGVGDSVEAAGGGGGAGMAVTATAMGTTTAATATSAVTTPDGRAHANSGPARRHILFGGELRPRLAEASLPDFYGGLNGTSAKTPPRIIGLDTCERFKATAYRSSQVHLVAAPAGLFNTGG